MAINLDGTLAGALEGQSRKPICSLVSSGWDQAIPFTGYDFEAIPPNQENPSLISLSDGRLFGVFGEYGTGIYENTVMYLNAYYTDVNRSYWTKVTIKTSPSVYDSFHHSAICQMANGNVGIVVIWKDYSADHLILSRMVVSEIGEVITDLTQIADLGDDDAVWVDNLHLIKLANDSYLMAYPYWDLSGETYSIRSRASSDFVTWGSEATLSIGGLDSPQHKTYNVSLIQITTGEVYLWFDYVESINDAGMELSNIYYSASSDNGGTWGTAQKVTNYAQYSSVAKHPMTVQKAANLLTLVYTNLASVLTADHDMVGWCADYGGPGDNGSIDGLYYDSVNHLLYARVLYTYIGNKLLEAVIILNTESWTIEKCYSGSTYPSIPDAWLAGIGTGHTFGFTGNIDPPYVPAMLYSPGTPGQSHVLVINYDADTITQYCFKDWGEFSLVRNMDKVPGDGMSSYYHIAGTWVDAATNRLYCLFIMDSYYHRGNLVGYIDLTEAPDPGTGYYTFHQILEESQFCNQQEMMGDAYFRVYPDSGYILIASHNNLVTDWYGHLMVYSLTSGNRIKYYNNYDYSGFHRNGVGFPIYVAEEGAIYGAVSYLADYDQQDRRGLLRIDLATDTMTYHRPTFLTINEYNLYDLHYIGNNEILMGCHLADGGVAIYNTVSDGWELKNRDNVEGFNPGSSMFTWDGMTTVTYDPDNEIIYTGRIVSLSNLGETDWFGILGFGREGIFLRPQYQLGTYTTQWDWTDPETFVSGMYNDQVAIALDPMDSTWGVWKNGINTTFGIHLQWDRESDTLELIDMIPDGTEIAVDWTLENPSQLSFNLGFGWLFDPNNFLSIYRVLVEKGRKMTLKFGEKIDDVDYWVNQGVFTITETKIGYERGQDPIMEVTCASREHLWPEMNITATANYDDAEPDAIVLDLLNDFVGIEEDGVSLPDPIEDSHTIYMQWIEMSFWDIMTQLAHHFGYVPKFDADDKFTWIRVTDVGDIVHVYPDSTKVINFTPDDSYSSFTNRVTVTSESHDWLEITYPEEVILSDQGTIGWWGEKKDKQYWFSADKTLRVLNPRLNNIEKPEMFQLFTLGGGGKVSVKDVDPEGYWIEIEIDGPDMILDVITQVEIIAALATICAGCDGGKYCGACIVSLSLATNILIGILTTIAHYSFEVIGQPFGKEKLTIQGQANDEDMQEKLGGIIVEEKMEDALCYTTAECQRVAEYELTVVKGQRNRVNFTKVAHLQDQLGDTIQIVHPYTQQPVNVFITSLKRRFSRALVGSSDGGFFDDIEGWRVTGGAII